MARRALVLTLVGGYGLSLASVWRGSTGQLVVAAAALAAAAVAAAFAIRTLRDVWVVAPLLPTAVPAWSHSPGLAVAGGAGTIFAAGACSGILTGRRITGVARTAAAVTLRRAPVVLFVAALITYGGQLHRKQSGDVYGTIYTSVSIVRDGSVTLNRFLPVLQSRSGEHPYMVQEGLRHRLYARPLAPGLAALAGVPAVAVLAAFGTSPSDFGAYMQASQLTGAVLAALAVALFYVFLTRLTRPRNALLVTLVFGWATFMWTISGQALWRHSPAVLALVVALLALEDRREMLAGLALGCMVAARPSTALLVPFLAVLLPFRARSWIAAAAGALPPLLSLAFFDRASYGCLTCMGPATPSPMGQGFHAPLLHGLVGNLVSPGRGIFVFCPVLLLALLGAWTGRRKVLYVSAVLGVAAHVVAFSRFEQWWGGEAFGPRELTDVLPLFALLIVPALDLHGERSWFRWLFGLTAAWSFAVQFLGAALWPGTHWYDRHPVTSFSTWMNPTDNDLTALFANPVRLIERGSLQLVIVAVGVAVALTLGLLPRRPRLRFTVRPSRPHVNGLGRLALLVPFAAVLIVAPRMLEWDRMSGTPRGGLALALVAGAFVLAWPLDRMIVSGLLLLALPIAVALESQSGTIAFALASVLVAAAERVQRQETLGRVGRPRRAPAEPREPTPGLRAPSELG